MKNLNVINKLIYSTSLLPSVTLLYIKFVLNFYKYKLISLDFVRIWTKIIDTKVGNKAIKIRFKQKENLMKLL